jgi:hypothetical protein
MARTRNMHRICVQVNKNILENKKNDRHLGTHYRKWENMEINLKYITSG